MLWRYDGSPAPSAGTVMDFPDLADLSDWATDAMTWAVDQKIVQGYNGTLIPREPAIRGQVAAMLWRYAGNPVSQGSLDGFTDAGKVSAYAAEALRWVVGAGLITGTDAGALNPQGEASRAEVSAMLTRFIMVKAE